MSQTSINIDPLTTDCMLEKLSLAIDEIKLVRTINDISEQVAGGDAAQLVSGRRQYLISELRFLNKRLRTVRDRADFS